MDATSPLVPETIRAANLDSLRRRLIEHPNTGDARTLLDDAFIEAETEDRALWLRSDAAKGLLAEALRPAGAARRDRAAVWNVRTSVDALLAALGVAEVGALAGALPHPLPLEYVAQVGRWLGEPSVGAHVARGRGTALPELHWHRLHAGETGAEPTGDESPRSYGARLSRTAVASYQAFSALAEPLVTDPNVAAVTAVLRGETFRGYNVADLRWVLRRPFEFMARTQAALSRPGSDVLAGLVLGFSTVLSMLEAFVLWSESRDERLLVSAAWHLLAPLLDEPAAEGNVRSLVAEFATWAPAEPTLVAKHEAVRPTDEPEAASIEDIVDRAFDRALAVPLEEFAREVYGVRLAGGPERGATPTASAPTASAPTASAPTSSARVTRAASPREQPSVGEAASGFDAYLEIGGIRGESAAPGFVGAIEILAFSWGASRSVELGDRPEAGKLSVSSFNVVKRTDAASAALLEAATAGTRFPTARVTLRRKQGMPNDRFLVYAFDDVAVEAIQWSGSTGGDDTPSESLSLAFRRVTMQYTRAGASTSAGVTGAAAPDTRRA
jgi:type VI secretion system secreted protein Hcp